MPHHSPQLLLVSSLWLGVQLGGRLGLEFSRGMHAGEGPSWHRCRQGLVLVRSQDSRLTRVERQAEDLEPASHGPCRGGLVCSRGQLSWGAECRLSRETGSSRCVPGSECPLVSSQPTAVLWRFFCSVLHSAHNRRDLQSAFTASPVREPSVVPVVFMAP